MALPFVAYYVGVAVVAVLSVGLNSYFATTLEPKGVKKISSDNSPPTRDPPVPTRSPKVFALQVMHAAENDPAKDQLEADKELFWKLFSHPLFLGGREIQRLETYTRLDTLAKIDDLSLSAESGDTVLISISSHGMQVKSTEEPDGLAEYMVLKEAPLSDTDFSKWLAKLQLGVRVYLFASSCHGGGFLNAWQPFDWKANIISFGVNEKDPNLIMPETMPYSLLGRCFSKILNDSIKSGKILSNGATIQKAKDIADQISAKAGPQYSDVTIGSIIITSSASEQQDFLNSPFLAERGRQII